MALLFDDVLLFPIKSIVWIAEKLRDAAEAELADESGIQEELLELQMLYEAGEITGDEYKEREANLVERLEAVMRYKEGEEEQG